MTTGKRTWRRAYTWQWTVIGTTYLTRGLAVSLSFLLLREEEEEGAGAGGREVAAEVEGVLLLFEIW